MTRLLTDDVYEYLARAVAYQDYDKGDRPHDYIGMDGRTYSFKINEVFDPWFSGFDAYGVTVTVDGRSYAVLTCRGTSSIVDILGDLDDDGIGFGQFEYNLDDVLDWCRDQVKAGRSIGMTGHSLGGALAQWYGAYCSRKLNVEFSEVVTFNSPGIERSQEGYRFDQGMIGYVCHYVNSGDIVSLAGSYFLPGTVKLYGSTYSCGMANKNSIDILDYWTKQHSRTNYFITDTSILPGAPGIYAIDSETLMDGDFNYLLLSAPAELANQTTWQLITFGDNSYLFNSEYAESILALTRVYGDLDLDEANDYLTRSDIEYGRKHDMVSLAIEYVFSDDDINLNLTVQSSFAVNGAAYIWLDCGTYADDILFNCNTLKFSQLDGTARTLNPEVSFVVSGPFGDIALDAGTDAVDIFAVGDVSWQVVADDRGISTLASGRSSATAEERAGLFASEANGILDVMMMTPKGRWSLLYSAEHQGELNGWSGTGECISLAGKNRLSTLVYGSEDATVLVLTDDGNGDALLIDDVFSDSFRDYGLTASRFANIDEIHAGAGDDIIDLTSRSFAFDGNLTIHGGDGDDVIWANGGNNRLYGDDGNDHLVGGSGDDGFCGGSGDDIMLGGGGHDVFCFEENWGHDVIEQLAGGTIDLWFSQNDGVWDAQTMTYTNKNGNSVAVWGVTADAVSLSFGEHDRPTWLSASLCSVAYLG